MAVVGAGLAASPLIATQATAAEKAEPSLLAQLRNQADKAVTVTDQAATGEIGFVRTKGDLLPGRTATDASQGWQTPRLRPWFPWVDRVAHPTR